MKTSKTTFYSLNILQLILGMAGLSSVYSASFVPAVNTPEHTGSNIKTAPLKTFPVNLEKKAPSYVLVKTDNSSPSEITGAGMLSSYLVTDLDTGKILAEKDSDKKLPIASLTKIMTAVVALDLVDKNGVFKASKRASLVTPTVAGIIAGEKMKLYELLNALLMTSANDSAEVIKEGIDNKYYKGFFVDAMNEKAKTLGLKNTHFSNPQGYDNRNNYSSAEDLALLSQYALTNYPLIAEIAKKDYQYIPTDNPGKWFDLYNWNGLLGVYPGVFGLKIGNTNKAGHTIIVAAQRDGYKILAIVLGATGVMERDMMAAELLDYGFSKSGNIDRANISENQLKEKYASWKYY